MSAFASETKRITPIQALGAAAIVCIGAVLLSSVFGGSGQIARRPASTAVATGANPQSPAAGAVSIPDAQPTSASPTQPPASATASSAAAPPSSANRSAAFVAPRPGSASAGDLTTVSASPVISGQRSRPGATAVPLSSAALAAQSANGLLLDGQPSGPQATGTGESPQVAGSLAETPSPTVPTPLTGTSSAARLAAPADSSTTGSTDGSSASSPSSVVSGETVAVAPGISAAQAVTAIETGQPVPGASTVGSTAASPMAGTNSMTYKPPAGDPTSPAYWGVNVYPSSQPPPAKWTPLVSNAYQTLPLSAAPHGYGPGNPFYGNGSAPWISGNPNDGTRDPITGQVWYPVTQAGGPNSPGWKLPTATFGG